MMNETTIFAMVGLVFLVVSFYFTLRFFHELRGGDERSIKQIKIAAVISLAIALAFLFDLAN